MSVVLPKLEPAVQTSNHRAFDSIPRSIRRETRTDEIRIAQYSAFPRENPSQQPRIGFTRDVSSLGMCLGVDRPEPLGTLLRVDMRRIDGKSMGASIARVVWCTGSRDGRYWMGLDLLCPTDRAQASRPSEAAEA